MSKQNMHVVKTNNGWGVKQEKISHPLAETRTQKEAIDIGKKIAKINQSELVIHGKDGKIRQKDSYGNDPCPPKDKN